MLCETQRIRSSLLDCFHREVAAAPSCTRTDIH
jgi:hypothetical protein